MPTTVPNEPDVDDALFPNFVGVIVNTPGASHKTVHDPDAIYAEFFHKPVQDELLKHQQLLANPQTIEAKTADYTVTVDDTLKILSNAGAAGTVTFTLPNVVSASGLSFKFYKAANQNMRVDGGAINKFRFGDLTNAANTYFSLGVQYSFVELFSDGTKWIVKYGSTDLA
jgi:hypothetical protein